MDDYRDISYINCRKIRKEKGMSLRELSERSGLSTVYLSNYENGKANITVASLYAIAKALNTSVNILLTPEKEDTLLIVPSATRFGLSETQESPDSVYQEFLTRDAGLDMQVTVMHMKPHTDSGEPKTHDCEEFVYVLQGTLELQFAGKAHRLQEGDFAYYDAQLPHCWKNPTETPVEFLAVASREGF